MRKTGIFTKIIAATLLVCMIFTLASCLDAIGGLKVESFTVDRNSVKVEYYIGEKIDFSGIKINVTYSDETLNTVYTHSNAKIDITFDSDVTATEGTKNITVSMKDPNTNELKKATVKVTVMEDPNAVKHDRYEIDYSLMSTTYVIGDTIDFTGIKVYEVMTDSTRTELTDLTKLTYEYDAATFTATAGNKTIPVKYNGESAGSISVRINNPEVETVDILSIVAGGTYKTIYEIGDTVDFTGLTVTITYEGNIVEVLELGDLTIGAVDTLNKGKKNVVISFTDPLNNEENSTSVTIEVINKRSTVVQFEKPSSITAFENDNKTEGKPSYSDPTFSGTFINGGLTYKVGDDNAFKFVPLFQVMEGTNPKYLSSYYTTVELSVYETDAYVPLTAEANGTNVTYKNGETVIAVVDTFRGSYDFSEDAIGKKIKISVVPDSDYYVSDDNPVTLEVEVIDAYNVYTAAELSIVDNYNSEWNEFKIANGLSGISAAGIVIHSDISVTENDVPESFFHVTTAETYYHKGNKNGEIVKTIPAGTKFLKDGKDIYYRSDADDFIIEGNFFQITTQDFPLVASHGVFGSDSDKHYGNDYSNSTLFYFRAESDSHDLTPEQRPTIRINNLALRGNAARNDTVDGEDKLVSGGGLIFVKSSHHAITYMSNTICNSYFITYFPNFRGGEMYVSDSKCYDSFQNAAFIYGDCILEIKDSYINGTGGPIMLADSVPNGDRTERYNPIITVTDTVMDSSIIGNELWFSSVGATEIVGQIKAIGAGLGQMGLGNFVDGNGYMNIMALLMNEGTNAAAALREIDAQGSVLIDGKGIERWIKDGYLWNSLVTSPAMAQGAPFLTVGNGSNPAQVIIYAGETLGFIDLSGNSIDFTNPNDPIVRNFKEADTITLSQGGLSVVFEFYH